MVCSTFCRGLMEFSATAISSARIVEIGTVNRHRSIVFFSAVLKPLSPITVWKFLMPTVKVAPPTSLRLL